MRPSLFLMASPNHSPGNLHSDLQIREGILRTCDQSATACSFTSQRMFGISTSFEKFLQKSKQGDLEIQKKMSQSMAFGIPALWIEENVQASEA